MKKLTTILAAVAAIALASCGGGGKTGGGKSVDIPTWATGEKTYFADRETKTAHAIWGKAGNNMGHKKLGAYKNGMISGTLVEMEEDGSVFVVLQGGNGPSLTKYMFEEAHIYSAEMLWHEFEGDENPINAEMAAESSLRGRSYTTLDKNYSTSYYFYKDEARADAIEWLSTLQKQPNQQSKYDAEAEGGVKTYKAAVGKAVEYVGMNELKADRFLALYLDCGAVVELRPKGLFLSSGEAVGRTIDCVVDADNKVIVYELTK